jgi:hypothetical protein
MEKNSVCVLIIDRDNPLSEEPSNNHSGVFL